MSHRILILPGIGNSGADHWQTHWERACARMRRIDVRDWDRPVCDEWVDALEAAVAHSGRDTVLVAHSLACLQLAHWAARTSRPIHAALLVAVPDPDGPSFPREAIGFNSVPLERFPFRSTVVASSNDPYGDMGHARRCAEAWGSRLVEIGPAGHVNASSGLGSWPVGRALLDELLHPASPPLSPA